MSYFCQKSREDHTKDSDRISGATWCLGLRHAVLRGWEPERPVANSLRLLPSGPDRVGEDDVRPTPAAHMAIWLRFCNGFARPKVTSATMFQIGFLEETLFRTIRN